MAEKTSETWQNVTAGRVVINRMDHRGELTRNDIIDSGKKFSLTTEERKMNQDLAARADLDVFSNGQLQPVRILDSVEDAREIASNPNLMSESEMRALMKPGVKTPQFALKIQEITNGSALDRLLALAEEEDATISKVEAIKTRLREVAPDLFAERQVVTTAPGGGPPEQRRPQAVTPR
jgi:uncharacterized protein YgbK (DUF1537 family)